MTTHPLVDRLGRPVKHGKYKTPEYKVWLGMRDRCKNPNRPKIYARYGGRGIKVCARWDDFPTFLSDMGLRPSPKHSIERKDNDGDYCPDNCFWALSYQQNKNKHTSIILTHNGRSFTISEWAAMLRVNERSLGLRIERGWSIEDAFTTPFSERRFRKKAGCRNDDGVPPTPGTKPLRGVRWKSQRRCWVAHATKDGARVALGGFNTRQEAERAVREFRGELDPLPPATSLPEGADVRKAGE